MKGEIALSDSVFILAARKLYHWLLRQTGLPPALANRLRTQAARFGVPTQTDMPIEAQSLNGNLVPIPLEPFENAAPSQMSPLGQNEAMNSNNNPWNTDKPFNIAGMWFSAQLCNEVINRAISGNESVGASQYLVEKYLKDFPDTRALVVGSNEGYMTTSLRQYGYRGAITETDIADKAMERAAAKYKELGLTGITQVLADLNKDVIPGEFDFIVAEGVLHHIEQIEFCLKNLFNSLRPGGLLIAIEYIGPVRFQLSDLNVQWINAALDAMPRSLRPFDSTERLEFPPSPADAARVYYVAASEEAIRQFDPSEACIGEILDELLCRQFAVLERKGFGGTLLSYMTGHFDFERSNHDPFAREWLNCLITLEQTVIKSGILPDHFCFYVLKKDSQ